MKIKYALILLLLGFTTLLNAQDYSWGNVPIGGGGFVSAIIPSHTEQDLIYARTDVGGAYRWDPATSEWIPLTDWVSEAQTGYLGVESLAIDPDEPNKLYMLVGISYFNNGNSAILKSEDYGETFEIINISSQFKAHGNGMGRQTGEKLAIDPNNTSTIYCGTRWDGLFKSTNSGDTWSRVNSLDVNTTPNENGISFVTLDASAESGGNTQTMFVGVSRTGTNFYRSDDGGATFSVVSGGPTDLMPHRAVLASDGNLYITYADGAGPHGHWSVPEPMENGQVWKYNTTNGAWTNITPAGYTRAFGGISIDPSDNSRILISTINTYLPQDNAYGDRVLISNNSGSSWTDVMADGVDILPNGVTWIDGHAIHWAGSVEFDPFDSKKVWITSGNGIFVNDDIDASPSYWRFEVAGLEETVPLDIESIKDGPLVSVIGDYDGFTHFDVTDYAPIHQPRMGTTTGLDVAEQNTDVRIRVGNSIFVTTDGGTTWTEGTINGEKGRVAVSADGEVFLHCAQESSTTYRSTNNGSSWSTVNGLSITEAKPTADPINSNIFYAYNPSNGSFMVSTDKGVSFSSVNSIGSNGSKIIRTNINAEGDVWVAMYNGGLKHTTDGGNSFTTIAGVSQCGAVGLGKAAPGRDYPTIFIWGTVNGTQGIYRSIDEGASWLRINDDDHQYGGPGNGQFVIGDWNDYGRVYMSTAGRGIVTGAMVSNEDCAGVENGSATIDNCDVCSGGSTGITPNSTCEQDCSGEWNGTAEEDNCGVCAGGSTGIEPNSTCPQPCDVPVASDTICSAGDVSFEINDTDNNYTWYDAPIEGNELEMGNTFTTSIENNTTFYVERATTESVMIGEPSNENAVGWADNEFDLDSKQILINVNENVTVNAVHVYVTVPSTDVVVKIKEQLSGDIIDSTVMIQQEVGKQRIPLNIDLIPGTYVITAEGTSESLFLQTEGASFPYSTPSGELVFLNYQDWATDWYGFFYDWEVGIGSSCIRTEVAGIIDSENPNCRITALSNTLIIDATIYPNPFTNGLNIETGTETSYVIYDTKGIIVESGSFNGSTVAGENLSNGLYQLKLTNQSGTQFVKIIKE